MILNQPNFIMKGIVNNFAVGASAYVTPHCFVVEIYSEGMLCGSGLTGGGFHDGIDGDDDPII